jgi:hypothetical protein
MVSYAKFIAAKRRAFVGTAVPYRHAGAHLYGFQRDLVAQALERGRSAVFADCGLGKTLIELDWGTNVPGRVLLLAPIAVSYQIEREAKRFGYDARVGDGTGPEKITLTNYEKLHRFDPSKFEAIILDESSILKSYDGKTRTRIVESFRDYRYKLAATATPAPNDFMELGNHAEFVGAMTRAEMLSMFFIHDGGSTQDWRLKGHAIRDFWRWVGSWASMIRAPSDMGYDDDGFKLPPLRINHEVVEAEFQHHALIPGATALDLNERRRARRASMEPRVARAAELTTSRGSWLYWCDLNDESAAIAKAADAVEVKGSDTEAHKRASLIGFAEGNVKRLVTKPRIGGWGMNWQKCHRMAFVGLSDSYEAFYQSTRRCWRFGQEKPVTAYLIYSEHERAVIENVLAKEASHREMQDALVREINR